MNEAEQSRSITNNKQKRTKLFQTFATIKQQTKAINKCHGSDGMNGATRVPNFRSPFGGWIRLDFGLPK